MIKVFLSLVSSFSADNLTYMAVLYTLDNTFSVSGDCFGCVLDSQIMSNVPAALLLSGFTDNYRALIVGTNIGARFTHGNITY